MLDGVHHDCVGPPLREDALISEDEPAAEEDSSCRRVLEMFVYPYTKNGYMLFQRRHSSDRSSTVDTFRKERTLFTQIYSLLQIPNP